LGGFPMELFRPAALVVYYVKKLLLVKTVRDQRELDRPPPFAYASSYSTVGILGILCIVYSVMFPLVEVCGAVAFAAYYLFTRYNHLHVFESDYESHGLLWPGGFSILIVGLYIYQLVMFGVFMTYKFFAAPALLPLMLLVR
jgi:calcium permeable stress-gated cation channel